METTTLEWSVRDVDYRPDPRAERVLKGATMDVPRGEFTALIGPNGAGKSSLLHLLLGTRRPDRGVVHFRDRPVERYSRATLARAVGVVAQQEEVTFPLTARAFVAMGRYVHLGRWRRASADDHAAIDDAMTHCDVARFADRDVLTLSGGERQRVRIARALAQQPDTLALDEPTTALDVAHEMATFELLRTLRHARGLSVLLITHNINLAARYADRVVVLHEGSVAAAGAPAAVLTETSVASVWHWPSLVVPHPGSGHDARAPQVVPLARPAAPADGHVLPFARTSHA